MSIGVITIEGVLSEQDDLRTAKPTRFAKPLYDGMRSQFNLLLLTSTEIDIARWWLKQQGIANWSSLLVWPANSALAYIEWRIDQVRSYLADGWEVAYYLDAHPYALREVSQMGVLTLTVSYPDKPPGWRDVHQTTPRPWSKVVDTVDVEGG
jgi:hypothetical protein